MLRAEPKRIFDMSRADPMGRLENTADRAVGSAVCVMGRGTAVLMAEHKLELADVDTVGTELDRPE